MARRPPRRSTKAASPRSTKPRAKPATHRVLREVLERLPKEIYDRTGFEVDGQGRVRHGWHGAHTLYARVASAWVKVAYWCLRDQVGQLIAQPPPKR